MHSTVLWAESQIGWVTDQTVDVSNKGVKQLISATHTPTKRQMALEYSDSQSNLRDVIASYQRWHSLPSLHT